MLSVVCESGVTDAAKGMTDDQIITNSYCLLPSPICSA